MAAHEEQLVLSTVRCSTIELGDLMLESLPLREVPMVEAHVAGISAVDEAEICGDKVESARVG